VQDTQKGDITLALSWTSVQLEEGSDLHAPNRDQADPPGRANRIMDKIAHPGGGKEE
jgi:hypothetical protein